MLRIVYEGRPEGEFNASTKAREDVQTIADRLGWKPFHIPTEYGVQTSRLLKPLQLLTYKNNTEIWKKSLEKLEQGDTLLIQYPLLNTVSNLKEILKDASRKKIRTIVLIHDLDSLRYQVPFQSKRLVARVREDDRNALKEASVLIAHNPVMKKALESWGCENVVSLDLFDYLTEGKPSVQHSLEQPAAVAGNLNPNKAGYLQTLEKLNVPFNLYGAGYIDKGSTNLHYKGKFPPDRLPSLMEGSFGLVWDGQSEKGGDGPYGNYLRYNNPHKLSLYLAAGMPVIVWKDSAASAFVENTGTGFAVSSLDQLESALASLTREQYSLYARSAKRMAAAVQNGEFLTKALFEALKTMDEKEG